MKIFVISLSDETARRESIATQFATVELDYQLHDAEHCSVDALQDIPVVDRLKFSLNTGRRPTLGELGCYQSHRQMWQRCVSLNEPILILESDAYLMTGFKTALGVLERCVHQMGFIRLQNVRRTTKSWKIRSSGLMPVTQIGDWMFSCMTRPRLALVGYALHPRTARALLKAFPRFIAPVDCMLQKTWIHKQSIFVISPPIIREGPHSADSNMLGRNMQRIKLLVLIRPLWKLYERGRRFMVFARVSNKINNIAAGNWDEATGL